MILYRISFILCLACACSAASSDLKDVLVFFKNNPPTEDIIVNNLIIMRGKTRALDCQRYDIIKNILSEYQRPITVLDLDARTGYRTFRIAHDFDTVCVMLTQEKIDDQLKARQGTSAEILSSKKALELLCRLNTQLKNIMLLEAAPDLSTLKLLSNCEHFDIVFAPDLLYRQNMPIDEWATLADATLTTGEKIIVELSPETINTPAYKTVIDYLETHGGERITPQESPTDKNQPPVYVISRPKPSLGECPFKDPRKQQTVSMILTDSYKKLFSKNGADRPWYPGINFMTFHALHGIIPTEEFIFEQLEKAVPQVQKNSNVLIQGNKLMLLP